MPEEPPEQALGVGRVFLAARLMVVAHFLAIFEDNLQGRVSNLEVPSSRSILWTYS